MAYIIGYLLNFLHFALLIFPMLFEVIYLPILDFVLFSFIEFVRKWFFLLAGELFLCIAKWKRSKSLNDTKPQIVSNGNGADTKLKAIKINIE